MLEFRLVRCDEIRRNPEAFEDWWRAGKLSPDAAVERIKHLPFEDIGFAKVDHHRALRQGFAEVIFGKGKTPAQVAEIVRAMLRHKATQAQRAGDAGGRKDVCGGKTRQPRSEISFAFRRHYD